MILRLSTRRKAHTPRTPMPEKCGAPGIAGPCILPPGHDDSFHMDAVGKYWIVEAAPPDANACASTVRAGHTPDTPTLAGDLVGRLTAALLAEPWTSSPRSAHGEHRYDAGCAVCCGDVDRLAAFVVRFMEPEVLAAEVDRFHADGQGEKLADAYDLDIQAEALREAADAWDNLGQPVQNSPIGVWLQARADQLEQEAEGLRDSIPTPILCQVIDVDGEPVRVQAAPDMPDEVRDALADVVRTIRRNHDRPGSSLPKLCPIGFRPHRPHTWTDGGPLRACPGVTDQLEDHRG